MKLKHNVLVTGAGTIVGQGLIKCLKLANSTSVDKYSVLACDMSENAPGMYRAQKSIIVPAAHSSNYIESIIKICNNYGIKAIMIGTEEELEVLVKNSNKIKNETGATVINSPINVVQLTRDKWNAHNHLVENGFACAESALPEKQEDFIKKHDFPIVVKPREGHGSLYFSVANNAEEINNATKAIQNYGWKPMLQEYLDGVEYTVGIVVDSTGTEILSSIPIRKIIRNGQTFRAFIEDNKEITETSEKISLSIGGLGPINIQGKLHNGQFKVFEINPRFSATLPIRAVAGVNEPDITFKNFCLGKKEKTNNFNELVCLRYWNEVYLTQSEQNKLKEKGNIQNSNSFTVDYF